MDVDDAPAPEPVRFRAGKKRKATYRQRGADEHDDNSSKIEASSAAAASPAAANEDATPAEKPSRTPSVEPGADIDELIAESSVAVALRVRNAQRGRRKGVGFGVGAAAGEESASNGALVLLNPDGAAAADKDAQPNGVVDRFTHQTGLLRDLNDKHMMEYIESRLSSRTAPASGPGSAAESAASRDATPGGRPASSGPATGAGPAGSAPSRSSATAAMQGHLVEVELGDEVRQRNIARTERVAGGGPDAAVADTARDRPAKKPRLGRDGKPMRFRNRRNSDDVKRDQLVDQILHESRLDVYQMPDEASSSAAQPEEDEAADERLLNQFRAQFLEDTARRRLQRAKAKQTTQPSRNASEDVLKGPKLGGSRNDRAAIRDLLLRQEKEGKKR